MLDRSPCSQRPPMTHMGEAAFRSRVLILAPVGRDAVLTGSLLDRGGVKSAVCSDLHELERKLVEGAGAAVITEEALIGQDIRGLVEWGCAPALLVGFPVHHPAGAGRLGRGLQPGA